MEFSVEFKNRTTWLKIQDKNKKHSKNGEVFGQFQNTPVNSSIFANFTLKLWKKELLIITKNSKRCLVK